MRRKLFTYHLYIFTLANDHEVRCMQKKREGGENSRVGFTGGQFQCYYPGGMMDGTVVLKVFQPLTRTSEHHLNPELHPTFTRSFKNIINLMPKN